jgi:thiamine pyrophosphate-dependent acetolactate synthase large subunit-like protein
MPAAEHRCCSGNPVSGTPSPTKSATADLIVAIDAGGGEFELDPALLSIPLTRLIHIDADLSEIGRNYQTELGVCADAAGLAAPADEARGKRPPIVDR